MITVISYLNLNISNLLFVQFSEPFYDSISYEAIAIWLAVRNHSFDKVDSFYFCQMLEYHYEGPLNIPSAWTIKHRVMELSVKGIEDTKKMIKV